MQLIEPKRIRAATQWDSSNTTEIQEMLDFLGSAATFTVMGADLYVNDTAAVNGSMFTVHQNNWLVEQFATAASGSVFALSDTTKVDGYLAVH